MKSLMLTGKEESRKLWEILSDCLQYHCKTQLNLFLCLYFFWVFAFIYAASSQTVPGPVGSPFYVMLICTSPSKSLQFEELKWSFIINYSAGHMRGRGEILSLSLNTTVTYKLFLTK